MRSTLQHLASFPAGAVNEILQDIREQAAAARTMSMRPVAARSSPWPCSAPTSPPLIFLDFWSPIQAAARSSPLCGTLHRQCLVASPRNERDRTSRLRRETTLAINLKQLEAFYWIARLGSFHAAARHLEMRQPSVSARVQELERHLGVRLFDRSGRSARLTPKGRELLTYADQMLRLTGEVEQRVGSRAALVGRVRFGVTSIPAVTWMPRMIRRLARAFPGIEGEFVVDTSENMRRQLLEGDLDLAFLAGPLAEPSLVTEELGRAAMAWLASPELPLPGPMVAPRDLADISVITDARGSFLHGLALAWFHAAGVEPQRHHACASLPTRIAVARQGLGVAIAPPTVAAREIADGHLRILEAEPALPPLPYVIAIAGGQVSPAIQALLQLAREAIAEEPEFHITVVPPP